MFFFFLMFGLTIPRAAEGMIFLFGPRLLRRATPGVGSLKRITVLRNGGASYSVPGESQRNIANGWSRGDFSSSDWEISRVYDLSALSTPKRPPIAT